ncbi:hypothetical protein SAMN05216573_12228 [Bradyrhizobium sp. Rc3b]|nr:hypothetical protein SAMN05216573_12228 [Bradyrhizobium sp. Rc3b]
MRQLLSLGLGVRDADKLKESNDALRELLP